MSRNLGFEPTEKSEYYFLSYNSEDLGRVSSIGKVLSNCGVPLWYDHGLEYGKDWAPQISKKIKDSRAVLLFLTKAVLWKEQSYVRKEYSMATEFHHKTVYVVLLDDINPDDVPVETVPWWIDVREKQTIEASHYATDEAVAYVIMKALGKPIPEKLVAALQAQQRKYGTLGISSEGKRDTNSYTAGEKDAALSKRRKGTGRKRKTIGMVLLLLSLITVLGTAAIVFFANPTVQKNQRTNLNEVKSESEMAEKDTSDLKGHEENMPKAADSDAATMNVQEPLASDSSEGTTQGNEAPTETDTDTKAETNADTESESLSQFKEAREYKNSLPKRVQDIPGIDADLARFLEDEQYWEFYDDLFMSARFLVEAYGYGGTKSFYTMEELPWCSFCIVYPKNQFLNSTDYFFTPSILSSGLSLDSKLEDVEAMLGKPSFVLAEKVSDFAYRTELKNPQRYQWEFAPPSDRLGKVVLTMYIDEEGFYDYCILHISPNRSL